MSLLREASKAGCRHYVLVVVHFFLIECSSLISSPYSPRKSLTMICSRSRNVELPFEMSDPNGNEKAFYMKSAACKRKRVFLPQWRMQRSGVRCNAQIHYSIFIVCAATDKGVRPKHRTRQPKNPIPTIYNASSPSPKVVSPLYLPPPARE